MLRSMPALLTPASGCALQRPHVAALLAVLSDASSLPLASGFAFSPTHLFRRSHPGCLAFCLAFDTDHAVSLSPPQPYKLLAELPLYPFPYLQCRVAKPDARLVGLPAFLSLLSHSLRHGAAKTRPDKQKLRLTG